MGTSTGERTPLGDVAGFDGGLTEVAPGTWAWLQPNGGLGESNAGLVVGESAALLVDTLWDERLTATMLAAVVAVCERAGAPLGHLFNTHGDGDHWYGNGLLGAGVEIVASAPAVEQMRSEPPSMLTRLAPVGTVAGLAGRVPLLPWADRFRGLSSFGSMLGNYEFGGIDPRVPERSFTEATTLDVGGRSVELSFVGPAHTVGDAIAWVPDTRTVFAGDILFNGVMPIMWAGPGRQLDRRPRADRGAGTGDGSRRPRPARRRRRGPGAARALALVAGTGPGRRRGRGRRRAGRAARPILRLRAVARLAQPGADARQRGADRGDRARRRQ